MFIIFSREVGHAGFLVVRETPEVFFRHLFVRGFDHVGR